ncbi:unnamed protein product [Rhizophagus irregularis]|nr:unnamed protein product [Rhizophagus irregularis]
MSSEEIANTWKNIFIDDDDVEFSYCLSNDQDEDMSTSDDDNLSSTTITTIIGSSTTESISNDDEILPFIWDKLAFNKAKELLEINNNEINDEISWEDISFDEITETESIITARTADDEINYQLEESSNQLTCCVLLDLIDGGHFFERQGSGKKTFSCEERHENDITNSLELLGKYILNVAASEEKSKKESLLLHLSSVLSIFDISSKLNKSAKSEQDPLEQPDLNLFLPSLFLIKTTLCLGKVDINKIMNKNYNITSETSKIFGEALGNITWKSRNEIHEKNMNLKNQIH